MYAPRPGWDRVLVPCAFGCTPPTRIAGGGPSASGGTVDAGTPYVTLASQVGVPTGRSSDRSLTYEVELGARHPPTFGSALVSQQCGAVATGRTPGMVTTEEPLFPTLVRGTRPDRPTPGDGPIPDQPTGNVDPLDGARRPHGTRASRRGRPRERSCPRGAREPWTLRKLLRCARPRASRAGGRPTDSRGAAGPTQEDDVPPRVPDRRGHRFGGGADGHVQWQRGATVTSPRSSSPANAACLRPSGCSGARRADQANRSICRGQVFGAPPSSFARCWRSRGRMGLQVGKPRRASSSAVRPRAVAATDFRAEQGLEVASALPANDRGARTRGDAGTASRKGNALEGRHRWECAEAVAGMRRRCAATR